MTAQEVYDEVREGLGEELCKILDSSGWSDVMINPDGSVWIDKDIMRKVPCKINEKGLNNAAMILASYSNLSYNTTNSQSLIAVIPIMNLRSIFWNKPSVEHTSAVFRRPSSRLISAEEMVEWGTLTQTQLEFMKDSIENHKNIVISGGTGSGKTTIMNSLINLIDDSERLFLIEDTPELVVNKSNKIHLTINSKYSYSDAIADALRGRPTRIIIGECRKGDQTLQMLKAWNTGHPGGMTTIHANNAEEVIMRMDQLCSEVSVSSQKEMINTAVDVIMQMKRLDGAKRKVIELVDIRNRKHVE